jgi:hypothetical protein
MDSKNIVPSKESGDSKHYRATRYDLSAELNDVTVREFGGDWCRASDVWAIESNLAWFAQILVNINSGVDSGVGGVALHLAKIIVDGQEG